MGSLINCILRLIEVSVENLIFRFLHCNLNFSIWRIPFFGIGGEEIATSSSRWRGRVGGLARDATRNALVLLDDGWSCQEVADAFLLNDDTIRGWFKLFEQRGIEGLTKAFGGTLPSAQEDASTSLSASLGRRWRASRRISSRAIAKKEGNSANATAKAAGLFADRLRPCSPKGIRRKKSRRS